MSPNKPRTSK